MIRVDRSGFFVLMLLVLAAWGSVVYAQQITGAITGSVFDSSGAAVAGASVKLTNTGTSLARTTATDQSGNFQFLLLQPGTYVMEATNPGFKTFLEVPSDKPVSDCWTGRTPARTQYPRICCIPYRPRLPPGAKSLSRVVPDSHRRVIYEFAVHSSMP